MEINNEHTILSVLPGSIAEEIGIEPGDKLVQINGKQIEDVFDYRYLINDEEITIEIRSVRNGKIEKCEIEKEYDEDLGIVFDSDLMDNYKSCHNKCIFCFIDQMPKGMRDTLYFKDDDSRLSFLQGNYITLTNMSTQDVERICSYKLSPINISIHTTNPELRCKMLHNRFAGDALKHIDKFVKAGIEINGQIVLCKGWNDGKELERTLNDIEKYIPALKSISVVPVGITKYREGLEKLIPFNESDSVEVLKLIHEKQKYFLEKYGTRIVYASDEWYLKANYEIPSGEIYEDFPQIENGVGMLRSLIDEVEDELAYIAETNEKLKILNKDFHVVTGKAAYSVIKMLCDKIAGIFGLNINVHCIKNSFFGEEITVSGLLTGHDIVEQLKAKNIDSQKNTCIMLPANVLRTGDDVFLDDMTLDEFENALQTEIRIVKSSGVSFVRCFTTDYDKDSYTNEYNKYETD